MFVYLSASETACFVWLSEAICPSKGAEGFYILRGFCFFAHITGVCVSINKRSEVHETGCGRHGARSSHALFSLDVPLCVVRRRVYARQMMHDMSVLGALSSSVFLPSHAH